MKVSLASNERISYILWRESKRRRATGKIILNDLIIIEYLAVTIRLRSSCAQGDRPMDAIAVPIAINVDHESGVEIGGRLLKGNISAADAGIIVTRNGDKAEYNMLFDGAQGQTGANGLRSITVKISKDGVRYELDHDEAFRPSANYCCVTVGSQTQCGWGKQCITLNQVTTCSDCS
jgi:hypothetical protein